MPHLTKVFQCDFCQHVCLSLYGAKKHEAKCIKNPAVKACPTCKYDISKGKYCTRHCDQWEGKDE